MLCPSQRSAVVAALCLLCSGALVAQESPAAKALASKDLIAKIGVSKDLAERYWEPRQSTVENRIGPWGYLFSPGTSPDYCGGRYGFPPVTLAPAMDLGSLPLRAEADRGSYRIGEGASLQGAVQLTQGDRTLHAASAQLDLASGRATFAAPLRVVEPGFILEGRAAEANINTRATVLQGVEFLLNPAQFRGLAEQVEVDGAQRLAVSKAVLTRCPPGNDSWRISVGRLRVDPGAKAAVVRQAVLRVGPVPVFYAPYLRLPINTERQSGWLFPSLAYSAEDGVDLALPYYFNLARNYDLTVTPRWIGERGLGLETEARYLNRYGYLALGGALLPGDDLYNGSLERGAFAEAMPGQRFQPADRWLYGMTHAGGLELPFGRLRTYIDYAAVSDGDYFRDLGTDIGVSSRVQLQRLGEVVFQAGAFEARLWGQRFQLLEAGGRTPYERLPELDLGYSGKLTGPLRWSLGAAWADFDRPTEGLQGLDAVTGSRLHLNPRLALPFSWPFGYLSFATGLQYTAYDLRAATRVGLPADFDETPERAVSFGSVAGGLFFERPVSLLGTRFLQTLEPQAFFLYRAFEGQSALPNFDSTRLTFQYRQLFREDRFSGVDRLGDAKQLSFGVTSRLLAESTGKEWFRASIGQLRYFEDRRVSLGSTPRDDDFHAGSAIATELSGSLAGALRWSGVLLWDPHDNEVDESSVWLGWQRSADRLLNVGYRKRAQGSIEQTDVSFYWPLSRRFRVLGRWNYDLVSGRSIEGLGGLEYNDCCWKLRLVARRFIDSPSARLLDTIEADEGIELQVVFRGLAGFGNKLEGALRRSIPGFQPELVR